MNADEIMKIIPHRPPFLWLDEIVSVSEKQIQARKFVDPQLELFQGHYPGQPILPGVLVCEAAFQAGAVLIAQTQKVESGKVPVVTRQNNTQFRQMVKPGDSLEIEVQLKEQLANAFFLTGKVLSRGKVAVRLEFACALADA